MHTPHMVLCDVTLEVMTRAATFRKNSQQLAECVLWVALTISQLRAIEATCIVSGDRRQPHKNLGAEHKITARPSANFQTFK